MSQKFIIARDEVKIKTLEKKLLERVEVLEQKVETLEKKKLK